MNIYKEYLQDTLEISIPENIFENEDTFNKYKNYIKEFVNYNFVESIRENAYKAIMQYCRPEKDYVIYKFKEYYGISQIINIWEPQEIIPEIKCFDEKYIYPIQELELVLDFKYHY